MQHVSIAGSEIDIPMRKASQKTGKILRYLNEPLILYNLLPSPNAHKNNIRSTVQSSHDALRVNSQRSRERRTKPTVEDAPQASHTTANITQRQTARRHLHTSHTRVTLRAIDISCAVRD